MTPERIAEIRALVVQDGCYYLTRNRKSLIHIVAPYGDGSFKGVCVAGLETGEPGSWLLNGEFSCIFKHNDEYDLVEQVSSDVAQLAVSMSGHK